MSRMTPYALPLAALLVALTTAEASAQTSVTTKRIATKTFDLRNDADVERLKRRVSSAAYYVCMHDELGRFASPTAASRSACHAEAMRTAMPSVDRQVAAARTDRSPNQPDVVVASVVPAPVGEPVQ